MEASQRNNHPQRDGDRQPKTGLPEDSFEETDDTHPDRGRFGLDALCLRQN